MTDKVQKIREEVVRMHNLLPVVDGDNIYVNYADRICTTLEMYIDSLQKEPKFKTGDRIKPIDSCLGSPRTIVDICDSWYVTDQGTLDFEYEDNWELVEEPLSEDLTVELNKYIKSHFTFDTEQLDRFGIEEKNYMYSMNKSDMLALVEHFTKWQKTNLWKPADGDDLPEIDREVVAFQETFPTDVDVPSLLKIVIAHRPNPEGYDGKSITTGQIEHYTPKTYDKGGWNIPNIVYWLDVELPKEIEL